MDGYKSHQINATIIGEAVQSIYDIDQLMHVQGVTSQGIFLKIHPNLIVFLTASCHPGPLTINIPVLPVHAFQPGEEVGYEDHQIRFRSGWFINLKDAALWYPPDVPETIHPSKENISDVYSLIIENSVKSLADLIPSILDNSVPLVSNEETRFTDLLTSEIPFDVKALENLVGWGRGLTPSGDDFLCGIALALSRYSIGNGAMVIPAGWQNQLQEMAWQKTTLISAAILKWAFMGQADKRIIDAFDEIMIGNGNPNNITNNLLSWGSSSGVDTFTGLVFWLSRSGYFN